MERSSAAAASDGSCNAAPSAKRFDPNVNLASSNGDTEQLRTAGTLGARVRADSRFHIELAVAAQSERLTRQEVRLQGEVAGMLWLPVGAPIDIEGVVADHHQIAMAVAAEDAAAARALTEQHIRSNLPRLSSIRIDLTGGVDGG